MKALEEKTTIDETEQRVNKTHSASLGKIEVEVVSVQQT